MYDPNEFVEATVFAEESGFDEIWFGDHFAPLFHSGKKSSFIWSVLPYALARTKKVRVGPLVTTPIGGRFHPAIIAQASATVDNMFPGRFLLGVGTGEAVNEAAFWNDRWPDWNERMARLTEGIELIRRMWREKEPFEFKGQFFSASFYYLYTKPKNSIPIYFSAVGKKASYHAGLHGDHLVTLSPRNDPERVKNVIVPEFKRGRSEARRNKNGEIVIHLDFSFRSPEELLRTSRAELSYNMKGAIDMMSPMEVEKQGTEMTLRDVRASVHSCKNWNGLIRVIEKYVEAGATEVIVAGSPDKKAIGDIGKNLLSVF